MFDLLNRIIYSSETLRKARRESQLSSLNTALKKELQSQQTKFASQRHIVDDGEVDDFIKQILRKDYETPMVVGLRKKECDVRDAGLELLLKEKDSLVILDLKSFTNKLASAFKKQLTSTALCFVADASSGLGTDMINSIASACDLAVVQEPLWMLCLAHLIQECHFLSEDVDLIVFSLCRLDAWRLRGQVGDQRMIVITVPGQSCNHDILPSLQRMFPCERHVFIYDGLVDSVSRGVRLSKQRNLKNSRLCATTIPISQVLSISNFDELLFKLPSDKAAIAESWISSVDIFLKLKHDEKNTGYIPFVCRLGFLLGQFGKLGNGAIEQSDLALTNLLQYMTGSKSRSLSAEFMQRAQSSMRKVRDTELQNMGGSSMLSEGDIEVIEACAFSHKGILIENKTLMDTVQPKIDWSLKAAKKLTSCACCMPGEGDEEEGKADDKSNGSTADSKTSLAEEKITFIQKTATGYVDGKTMFAFDPSRFSGI